MNDKSKNTKSISTKTKMTAIFIVVFVGPFAWLYTVKKSAPKFIIGFFVPFAILSIYLMTEFIFILFLVLLACFAMWLWALIDTAIKPDSFFKNYPNE